MTHYRAPQSERGSRMSGRRRVMIVDDSPIALEATRAMLEEAGFDVVLCDSPIGAMLRVINERPDVVLVDLDMASLPGDRLIASLKSGLRTSSIPVCLYTGKDADAVREAMRRSGADAHIAKGSDAAALALSVRRMLMR